MPFKDVLRSREYQNTRNAKIRAEAKIDAALVGNSQLAQAEERRRIAQVLLDNADREVADVRSRAFDSSGANGLDKYGFPIGTHDELGREFGQLDTAMDERASLNKQRAKLNSTQKSLTTELDKVNDLLKSTDQTTEQKIQAKTRIAAIKELITENEAELKPRPSETEPLTLHDKIFANNHSVEKLEAAVQQIKDDITNESEGGRFRESKLAQGAIQYTESEQKKRDADVNLQGGRYGKFDRHHYEVQRNTAIDSMERNSPTGVNGACDARVAKLKESLKIYTLKP